MVKVGKFKKGVFASHYSAKTLHSAGSGCDCIGGVFTRRSIKPGCVPAAPAISGEAFKRLCSPTTASLSTYSVISILWALAGSIFMPGPMVAAMVCADESAFIDDGGLLDRFHQRCKVFVQHLSVEGYLSTGMQVRGLVDAELTRPALDLADHPREILGRGRRCQPWVRHQAARAKHTP